MALGLNWPGTHQRFGDLADDQETMIRKEVDRFADAVKIKLEERGFPLHASLLWRPFNVVIALDAEKIICVFTELSGGLATLDWLDHTTKRLSPQTLASSVQQELGAKVTGGVMLPLPANPDQAQLIERAAMEHVDAVERSMRLGRLGDLTGVEHLEPHLRTFLDQHPDPDRNVFVMMRFLPSKQLDEAYATIKKTLSERGFHAVRADDRDYTGELWSNIEVYLTCCRYGIAIFEDIEQRDFNPNVSLELGYMLGRRKRCLILKEKRLPNLPADVVHRMYKPFDMFDIEGSVSREVARWVDVDLGHGASQGRL